MITLRTGLPGSGKTLRTIALAVEEVRKGREVYALNVNGLDYEATGIKPWEKSIEDWRDLPRGALLIVDEVQAFLRARGPQAQVPDWIEAFTRNRHFGIDLWFVSQSPMLIDPFVRRLVNYHEHLVRLDGGFNKARVYYTEGVMELGSRKVPKDAEFKLWTYPPGVFDLYKSAEQHTVKRRIPQGLKIAALCVGLVLLAVIVAGFAMDSLTGEEAPPAAPEAAQPPPQQQAHPVTFGSAFAATAAPKTAAEWLRDHVPLVDGIPWSAPAYHGFKPELPPKLYCMIGGRTGCACFTEQVTRVRMDDGMCRAIVMDGLYDPFLTTNRRNFAGG